LDFRSFDKAQDRLDFGLGKKTLRKTLGFRYFFGIKLNSKTRIRKLVGMISVVFTFAMCGEEAEAQQRARIPRIGILVGSSLSANTARIEAFREGLRELGYIEGKNIVIESRSADGKFDRLPQLATEMVRLNVDVIVTTGPIVNRPAKQATSTIPIVMGFDNDPVGNGFVNSLARPGGNMTGLSNLAPEISGKQLELLKEIVPKLSRVAIMGNSKEPANPQLLAAAEIAAGAFKLKLQYLDIPGPEDIEIAFRAASKERAEAVVVLGAFILNRYRVRIAEVAAENRLPAIYNALEWVEDGGLMSYGTSFPGLFRRAATYVDKILKGAKPADLPVEQPTKFDLVINLKAARQIGLTIPQRVLARTDRVIK
jgi:putative ABC transport system substrate-binding protein